MEAYRDIDTLLKNWEFQPGEVNARLLKVTKINGIVNMPHRIHVAPS